MGGFTPNEAIPYPFETEVVDAADVQATATVIDTALGNVAARVHNLLQRPLVNVYTSAVAIATGVTTTLVWTFTNWNPDALIPLALPNTQVPVDAGLWAVRGMVAINAPGTITDSRASLLQNGAVVTRIRAHGDTVNSFSDLVISGDFYFAVAGFMQMSCLWNGTGAAASVTANFSLTKVRDP